MAHYVIEVELFVNEEEAAKEEVDPAIELRYVIETAIKNFTDLEGVENVYLPPTRKIG